MSFEFTENVTLELPSVTEEMRSFAESTHRENNKLIIEVAAIHAGLTSNHNMYTAHALEASLGSWVTPYPKPIILNHDPYSESVGRVMASRMDVEEDGTRYVRLQVAITDPQAIEKVMDQRYLTGSVGGNANSAKCSICEVDWAKANFEDGMPCRHKRGKVYEGKYAYFELGELSFNEYSFVNIPADKHSGVRASGEVKDEEEDSDWSHSVKMYSLDMNNESVTEMADSSVNILESMKPKEARATYMNLKGTFLSVSALDCKELETEISEISEKANTNSNESDNSTDSNAINEEKEMSTKAAEVAAEEVDEDILDVTEQLSADLAQEADEDTSEKSEEKETEETAELSEESDVKPEADDAEEVSEEKAEDAEESEAQLDTEDGGESAKEEDEAEVGTSEESEGETEEVEVSEDEEDERDQLITQLKEQNAKLRNALHKTLVERVVDRKIALGLEEAEGRKELVEEHSTRTAASLADALRDLDKFKPAKVEESVNLNEAFDTQVTSMGLDGTGDEEVDGAVKEDEQTWEKRAEDFMVDVFMNRKKI